MPFRYQFLKRKSKPVWHAPHPRANPVNPANPANPATLPACIMCTEPCDCVVLSCGHDTSCRRCLWKWWITGTQTPRCPTCRGDVTAVRFDRGRKLSCILKKWTEWYHKQQQPTRNYLRIYQYMHI